MNVLTKFIKIESLNLILNFSIQFKKNIFMIEILLSLKFYIIINVDSINKYNRQFKIK
mgnify:CR=1 FL=1|jgi:hypothetical protein